MVAVVLIAIIVMCFVLNKDDTRVRNVSKHDFTVKSSNLGSYTYHGKIGESNIFYLGIDDILIDKEELVQYLNSHDLDDAKKWFNRVDKDKEVGSTIYTCDDTNKCDDNLKVLFCNTAAGDKDVYFAHKDVELTSSFCNNDAPEPEED